MKCNLNSHWADFWYSPRWVHTPTKQALDRLRQEDYKSKAIWVYIVQLELHETLSQKKKKKWEVEDVLVGKEDLSGLMI